MGHVDSGALLSASRQNMGFGVSIWVPLSGCVWPRDFTSPNLRGNWKLSYEGGIESALWGPQGDSQTKEPSPW